MNKSARPCDTDSIIARLENALGQILYRQKPDPKVTSQCLCIIDHLTQNRIQGKNYNNNFKAWRDMEI